MAEKGEGSLFSLSMIKMSLPIGAWYGQRVWRSVLHGCLLVLLLYLSMSCILYDTNIVIRLLYSMYMLHFALRIMLIVFSCTVIILLLFCVFCYGIIITSSLFCHRAANTNNNK